MRWPWSGRRSATRCDTAGGTAVTVTVEAGDDLLIDVVDDGIGIDPRQRAAGCGTSRNGRGSAPAS